MPSLFRSPVSSVKLWLARVAQDMLRTHAVETSHLGLFDALLAELTAAVGAGAATGPANGQVCRHAYCYRYLMVPSSICAVHTPWSTAMPARLTCPAWGSVPGNVRSDIMYLLRMCVCRRMMG